MCVKCRKMRPLQLIFSALQKRLRRATKQAAITFSIHSYFATMNECCGQRLWYLCHTDSSDQVSQVHARRSAFRHTIVWLYVHPPRLELFSTSFAFRNVFACCACVMRGVWAQRPFEIIALTPLVTISRQHSECGSTFLPCPCYSSFGFGTTG